MLLYLYRILGRYGNISYWNNDTEMILQILSNLLAADRGAVIVRIKPTRILAEKDIADWDS